MLKAEIFQTESSIFHRTVLEAYWEFGARIGTKMKLTVSTFSSFRLFLFSKTTKLLNFWKRDNISFQNTTLTSTSSRVCRDIRMGIIIRTTHIEIWDIWKMYHRGSGHSLPNCDCIHFGGHRKRISCVLVIKIIMPGMKLLTAGFASPGSSPSEPGHTTRGETGPFGRRWKIMFAMK